MRDEKILDKFDKLRVELNDKLKVVCDLGGGDAFKENDVNEDLVKLIKLIRNAVSIADFLIEDLLRIKVELEREVNTEEIIKVSTKYTSRKDGRSIREESVSLSTENTIHVREGSDNVSTIHTDVRGDGTLYRCEICEKSFSAEINLKRHRRQKHSSRARDFFKHQVSRNGKRLYTCKFCKKSFNSIGYKNQHERIHTGEKRYGCHLCPKSFILNTTLANHLRYHSGEKLYSCEICNKSFTRPGNLTVHQKVHTGEKPFNCDVCGKGFAVKSNLEGHLRVHTGEKPFSCDICGISFMMKNGLNRHTKRFHEEEKSFSCDVCEKTFALKYLLTEHQRIHTGEKPYNCELCGISFTRSSGLLRHSKKFHREVTGNHGNEVLLKDEVCADV